MDLPPLRNQIDPREVHIDSTPDGKYALRILQYYRSTCDTRWEVHGLPEGESIIYDSMNEHQKERAKELDVAIKQIAG